MLTVKTPDEVLQLLNEEFGTLNAAQLLPLDQACGRVLFAPVESSEFVPSFDRSTVDGYAISASDSFGCSDSIPALLELSGHISMGEMAPSPLKSGCCMYVPTGGAIPEGADAVVMIEYTEDYGDGTIGIMRPAAPGENLIYKGDDVYPGKTVLPAGHRLSAQDIGALAAMGFSRVEVYRKPVVGIISTGDELVPVDAVPAEGQVRDVNSAMLAALVSESGAEPLCFGIIHDDRDSLSAAVKEALQQCDALLISGGSSVGVKDATSQIIESMGQLLFHGIAIKPGKPTILGKAGEKAVWGLPGHPVAAFFVCRIFVRAYLARLCGRQLRNYHVSARLTESVGANHGRAQYNGVRLSLEDGIWCASPIRTKSGLISSLAASDGYFCIPRDKEGAAKGETVSVMLHSID